MRIPFEYSYSARYMLRNGKRSVGRTIVDSGEIDIPVVASADAPVAATWQKRALMHDRHEDRHVRTFLGALYEPFAFSSGGRGGRAADAQTAVAEITGSVGKPSTLPRESEIAHRLGDNRTHIREQIFERLSGLLVVDGNVYSKCETPKLNVTVEDGITRMTILRRFSYEGHHRSFGIDRTAVAPLTEFASVSARLDRTGGTVAREVENVEVSIPEALHFDKNEEAVARTVGQAVIDNEYSIHNWPSDVVREFLSIRDGYRGWLRDPGSVDVVDLLDRVYDIFTTQDLYNQNLLPSFLANYETAQRLVPAIEVNLSAVMSDARPAGPKA